MAHRCRSCPQLEQYLMKHILLILLALAVGPVLAANHQNHPASTAESASSRSADAFSRLDLNKDGSLSQAELAKHPMAGHAGMVDANKDGRLDRTEFNALQSM